MRRFLPFAALLGVALVLGCQDLGTAVEASDGLGPQFAKEKSCDPPDPHPSCKPGEDPPPPVEGSYTLNDLGEGSAIDVSDDGKVVGGKADEATLWRVGNLPVSLGKLGATSSFAVAISKGGQYVGGETHAADGSQAVRWVLNGDMVASATHLLPVSGHPNGNVSAINDLGQAVGQGFNSFDSSAPRAAVLWGAAGTPTNLGHLAEGTGGWAIGLNNSGHIVGKTFFDFSLEHQFRATLWVVTDGAVANIVDLTWDSDESGDNQAVDVTEVVGGMIRVVGYSTFRGVRRQTVWTVDAQTGVVTDRRYGDDALSGQLNSINDSGVAVTSNLNVWDIGSSGSLIEILPELSGRCRSSAQGINNGGDVAGWGGIKSKGRCINHAVVWTKNQ